MTVIAATRSSIEYWPIVRFREIIQHPEMLFLTPCRVGTGSDSASKQSAHGGMFNLIDIPIGWRGESEPSAGALARIKPAIDAAFAPVARHAETGGRIVFSRGLRSIWPAAKQGDAADPVTDYLDSWLTRLLKVGSSPITYASNPGAGDTAKGCCGCSRRNCAKS